MCKKKVTSVELSLHTGANRTFIGQNYFLNFSSITVRKVQLFSNQKLKKLYCYTQIRQLNIKIDCIDIVTEE